MIAYTIQTILLVILAPFFLGFIKWLKMWLLFKKPLSPLQNYKTLKKLLYKEIVISKEASLITPTAPYLVLAPLVLALAFLPPVFESHFTIDFVDAFTITGLLSLSTFFLMLLGLDSASSFGGMGSSREAFIAALVEPAMILTIFAISLMAGDLKLSQAALKLAHHFPSEHMASFTFAAISFFILLLAENGRLPIDNPETHLELTMVHEAMILDVSGLYLAFVEAAASLKFIIFATLFATLFMPFGFYENLFLSLVIFLAKVLFICVAVALIELNMAKLRLFKVPNLLGIAIVFAFLSLISFYILGA